MTACCGAGTQPGAGPRLAGEGFAASAAVARPGGRRPAL